MPVELKVFVGIEDGGELSELGEAAKEQGAIVGKESKDIIAELEQLQPNSVVLSGGSLFVCVPEIIHYCLDNDMDVAVDLKNCRINPDDKGSKSNLARRRKELELGMENPLHTFRNLKIRT